MQGATRPLPGVARIAVLRCNGIGDLMFALPALEALRAAYPQAAAPGRRRGRADRRDLLVRQPRHQRRLAILQRAAMPWLRWLRHPAVPRYALAVAVMVAAMTLTVAAEPVVRRLPTAPVFAAILVVTWLVGLGPGILATALAVAVLDYLTDAPPYRLHLDNRDLGWMVLFSSTVLVSAWLASLVRRLQGERERALVREREARLEAERATRAKEEFLAIVSHELRAPLTAILGWVAVLKSGRARPDQVPRALETIERSTRLQAKLIDDLLLMSQAAAGKLDVTLRPMELGPVIAQVVQAFEPRAGRAGVRLEPRIAPWLAILGDAERLQQAIGNLVGNAIKFTPPAGSVMLEAARQGERIRVAVRDTGEGFDPAIGSQIFDPFRQGEPGLRRRDGLGLGLAITRHIVESHGGTVWAESAGRGHGATFIIELPAAS